MMPPVAEEAPLPPLTFLAEGDSLVLALAELPRPLTSPLEFKGEAGSS